MIKYFNVQLFPGKSGNTCFVLHYVGLTELTYSLCKKTKTF